ncbi:Phosphoglycerate dehydrogenase [Ruegeria halocynthiae]|uniref:Phosphoglycerate dehydrogenase n=1 Tax=Ruegeria halocynthiae TaxID=985054 RepID=A0A1H2YZK8_9RHOB|nr:D-2-hydroxyacid dehydrogenase [Ruegeria halocynthiae]SDX10521.1 Phosphoglycerate dehydrogenase [Ruegeria halocynthiae]
MPDTPRIVLHNNDTAPLARWLRAAYPQAGFRECNSYEALPALIESYRPEIVYSVRFAGTPGFPRDALFGPYSPRWIANGGAGTDHYGQWDPQKTIVTNAAGVAAGMMAEYILGGFLHFTLDIPGLQKDKAARVWNARKVRPLAGKSLLIVGLGHTGQAVSARAKAFGMKVLGTRARPEPMEHVDEVHASDDLHDLLPRADFIAVSTPLIPATRGLIGKDEIAAMKPGVIFADVSRGGVVDQSALYDALKTRHVAAAALDVFETEPLPEISPLWALENVIISPHCSSVYADWEQASFELFIQNLGRWMRGERLVNIVNPARGY